MDNGQTKYKYLKRFVLYPAFFDKNKKRYPKTGS